MDYFRGNPQIEKQQKMYSPAHSYRASIYMNNIAGQKFYRLTAIEPTGKYNREIIWKFKCDCGNIIEKRGWLVTTGHTKSCGCFQKERMREVHVYPDGEAGFNIILRDYKYRCRQKHIEFALSTNKFRELITGNCFYCGASPSRIRKNPTNTSGFTYNGIDRLNNSMGYIDENCVSCCKKCNTMKSNLNYEEFKQLIYLIHSKFQEHK